MTLRRRRTAANAFAIFAIGTVSDCLSAKEKEETEIVRETLGDRPAITGFYSYGELAPMKASQWCELHNQTMTITLMKEV